VCLLLMRRTGNAGKEKITTSLIRPDHSKILIDGANRISTDTQEVHPVYLYMQQTQQICIADMPFGLFHRALTIHQPQQKAQGT
jgi:hypothetical protein